MPYSASTKDSPVQYSSWSARTVATSRNCAGVSTRILPMPRCAWLTLTTAGSAGAMTIAVLLV